MCMAVVSVCITAHHLSFAYNTHRGWKRMSDPIVLALLAVMRWDVDPGN